ncbi:hypothetical protein [Lignipirellula cremea]|uniref:Uncharacterized protein n=1 Tax=Lignipirellula cremea TaxID=2528010 RepID=A0A518DP05_9BACT|nr:hypothetical protein [Lignipirellula cremea]QDU93567.1 hypothetical protein Pla8534_13470 [Lignipirellula cremea]
MNADPQRESTPDDRRSQAARQVLLDRLVEGDLLRDEYCRLLAQLEAEPSGWRECALAFLESQAWREDCSPAASAASVKEESSWLDPALFDAPSALESKTSDTPGTKVPTASGADRPQPAAREPGAWLINTMVVAASVLLAFGLGVSVTRLSTSPADNPQVAVERPAPRLRDRPASNDGGRQDPAPTAVTAAPVQSMPRYADGTKPRGDLTLVVDGGQQVNLPVYDLKDIDQQWLREPPRAIAEEDQQILERFGYRVLRDQRLTPVRLPDGSYVLVPVEGVQIVPAAGNGFQ